MHFGLGARDGALIMSATHAVDIAVTPENSNALVSLGATELATAKQVLSASRGERARYDRSQWLTVSLLK